MRKNRGFLSIAVAVAVGLVAGGLAPLLADEPSAGVSVRPVELYGCNYKDGKGMADVMAAAGKWNAWMDQTGQHDYWAFLLIPYYHSPEMTFDVIWAGGWKDGASMGAGLQRWVTEGGEEAAEFDKAVTCNVIQNFALLDLSKSPNPPDSGPVSFSTCTVKKGRKFADAMAAVHSWIDYEKAQGVASDSYLLFPAYGESTDAHYSFKWVTTSDWANFGKSYDEYGTGGGYKKAEELFDGLLDCDNARLYVSRRVRKMQMK